MIRLIPSPISIKGTNILANSLKNKPTVIETPVKTNMTKVKTIEKTNTMIAVKHPNNITSSLFQNIQSIIIIA